MADTVLPATDFDVGVFHVFRLTAVFKLVGKYFLHPNINE